MAERPTDRSIEAMLREAPLPAFEAGHMARFEKRLGGVAVRPAAAHGFAGYLAVAASAAIAAGLAFLPRGETERAASASAPATIVPVYFTRDPAAVRLDVRSWRPHADPSSRSPS